MAIVRIRETCGVAVNELTVGAGRSSLTVGGEKAMPFMYLDDSLPHKPVVGLEITDMAPTDLADPLRDIYGNCVNDARLWAKECIERYKAQMLCVRLISAHPDMGNRKLEDIVNTVKAVAAAVDVPLIIVGCGEDERDNEVLPAVSQALKGRNALFGVATQTNYRTLTATCLADGHAVIAESPIDVNIAKQVNILISDMGFDQKRIVMHPTTTALGYGMEYVYSINERARLAAFVGDSALGMPFIVFTGPEVWKVKEAKMSETQGVAWEVTTAVTMVQSGTDIIVMGHPHAAQSVMGYIQTLTSDIGGGSK